jgi:hypothetical protein
MKTVLGGIAVAALCGAASGQSLIDLRALPGGQIAPIGAPPGIYEYATATTISENGLQVGGTSNTVAVRYSLDGNRPVQLPAASGGVGGAVTGVTDNGTLVGWNLTNGPFAAQLWDASNNRTGLGPVATNGTNSYLMGVSRDGSVRVGYGLTGGQFRAATHTASGWTLVPTRSGSGGFQIATNISRDGSTIVGFDGAGAFKYSRSLSAYQPLTAPAGATSTTANDTSPDGSITAGAAVLNDGFAYATLWNGSQPNVLGRLTGYTQTVLTAVSSDGLSAVGFARNSISNIPANDARANRAIYWSPSTGVIDLNVFAASLGIQVPGDGILTYGADISGNGSVIVGNYQNSIGEIRPFYLTVPAPSAVAVLGLGGLIATRRRR